MRGFELLTTRPNEKQIDIPSLEDMYGILLPEKYKLFAQTFILGDGQIKYDYIGAKENYSFISGLIYEPKEDLLFSGFNTLENALSYMRNLDAWYENKLIPIGHAGINGALVLGTTGGFIDKIIFHDFDTPPFYTVIADDIFQFVRGLILRPIPEIELPKGVKFNSLYKNWNEDFWRVRE